MTTFRRRVAEPRTQYWLLGIVCAVSALLYSLVTGHIWEDFFITFKFSQNMFDGHGLVYEPGVRVHGFTSPLGVLLPGVCYFLTGRAGYLPAIWLFRVLCIPFYAGTGVLLLRLIPAERGRERLFFGIFYVLEAKALAFSMNGMETAFMLFFLASAFAATVDGIEDRWLAAGLAWAGLMWSRPDSCVHVAALATAALAFPATNRRAVMLGIVKAAAVTTLVYLPWFLWAWSYYGTPVPHTIVAKAHTQYISAGFSLSPAKFLSRFARPFEPVYAHATTGWPPPVFWLCWLLATFGSLYWLVPWGTRPARLSSLVFAILNLYFVWMPFAYPWYLPPAAVLGLLACVLGAFEIENHCKPASNGRVAVTLLAVASCVSLGTMAGSWLQLGTQQRVLEMGHRRRVGEWLRENTAPGDRVYLECLGYIGYFSGCRMLDYPGLCSPDVVTLSREGKDFRGVIERLHPEWLVLRPREAEFVRASHYANSHYRLKALFDANPALDQAGYYPGESRFDAVFAIYQHVDCPNQLPDFLPDDQPVQ